MNDHQIYQLLKIIQHNGNILDITNQGFEFGQLTYFIDTLFNENFIVYDVGNKITVSDLGQVFIRGYESNNNIKQYSKWILPRSDMWKKPINEFDIYIPQKK